MGVSIGASILSGRQYDAIESSLIDRCRRRDMEAFGRLVDAYQNRVFGFVRRMINNPEEAADVTQDVFIRAFQSFDRFDGRSSLRTWLFRIAYNLCIDRARRSDRRVTEVALIEPGEEGETMEVADMRWQPEQIALDDELMGVVEEGILNMSEKLRSVLLLHDKEEMAYEEIANLLDVPIGTVKSRLFLARAHLQNVLKTYLEARA
jgi:RNA polymerase sigma-70 factor (ECF subfamily)